MKYLLVVVFLMFVSIMYSQDKRILVNPDDLPKEIYDKYIDGYGNPIANNQNKTTVESTREWVSLGKEVGEAIDAGLGAVVKQAENFGNTRVGNFTLIMIAWKIIGKDIIRILIGSVFIIIFTIVFFIGYLKNCIQKRYLISIKGSGKDKVKEYETREPIHSDYIVGYWVCYILSLALSCIMMFT